MHYHAPMRAGPYWNRLEPTSYLKGREWEEMSRASTYAHPPSQPSHYVQLILYSGYHYSHFPDRKVRGKEITKSAQEQIPRKQTSNLTYKHRLVCERCYMHALGSAIAGPGREGTGSFQSQSYVRLGNSPAQKTVLDLKIC